MKRIPYKTNQNHPKIREYREAVERGKQNYHVLPAGDVWVVKKAGSEKASKISQTQLEAKKYAYIYAENQGSSVLVHGLNGQIRERKDF